MGRHRLDDLAKPLDSGQQQFASMQHDGYRLDERFCDLFNRCHVKRVSRLTA